MHQGFAKKTKQGWLRAGYPKMQEKAFKEIVARLQNLCTFKTKWKLCLTLPKGAPEDQNQRCQIFKVFGLPQLLESICSQTESNAIACISIPLFFSTKGLHKGQMKLRVRAREWGADPLHVHHQLQLLLLQPLHLPLRPPQLLHLHVHHHLLLLHLSQGDAGRGRQPNHKTEANNTG